MTTMSRGVLERHRTVGIDLAIRASQVAQLFDNGKPVGKPIRFRFTADDLKRFVRTIKEGVEEGTPITAVMEPTDMSWFPVATWLKQSGVTVIRVKGQRVKALRKYLSEHAKTDTADAHVLGTLPGFGTRNLDPVIVPSAPYQVLQRLTKQRNRYQAQICASRRRLLDLIRWSCPSLEAVLPGPLTQLTLAILEKLLDPPKVLAMRPSTLVRFLARHASGDHPQSGPFIANLAQNLQSVAKETLALYGDHVDFTALQCEVAQEVEHVRLWQRHIEVLEQRTTEISRQIHPDNLLQSIPGIGPVLAPLILGVLGEVHRFRSVDHLRGFCGLFPVCSSSGGVDRPGQWLAKSGNNRLKCALYTAADVARKIDPELALVYRRLMVDKGHHHKQALCAVANRLLNRIYHVLKTGQPYILRDLDHHPISVQEGKRMVKDTLSVPQEVRDSRRKHPGGPGMKTTIKKMPQKT